MTEITPPENPQPSDTAPQATTDPPKPPAGNASLTFSDAPGQITGSVHVIDTSNGHSSIRFTLNAEVELPPDAMACSAVVDHGGDGKTSDRLRIGRDFKTQRYVINPDGNGEGVDLLGSVGGDIAITRSAPDQGAGSAVWKVETRCTVEVRDRLLELAGLPVTITTHDIQGKLGAAPTPEQGKLA